MPRRDEWSLPLTIVRAPRVHGWGWLTAGALLAAALGYVETEAAVRALVAAFFIGLVGLAFTLTRRAAFALLLVTLLFGAVFAVSDFKFGVMAMNLHVYDVFFYLFSLAQVSFFKETFGGAAASALAGLVVMAAALVVCWRVEPAARLGRTAFVGVAAASLLATTGSAALLAQRGGQFFDARGSVFSAFIASLGDVPALVRARGVFEIAAQASLGPGAVAPIACNPQEAGVTPPDIVLFLNESAMPPGVYPQLAYPDEARALFTSFDGTVRRLRVETFGGGTWLSDFSALTGLSTNMFGGMRNFAAQLTAGRLRHTLPQYLKACGYEATLIYPSLAEFAGSARFYRAIGFDRIIDRQSHKAPDERQRDAFYLGEVRKVFDRARAQENRRPQFIVASSMATHSPWNFRFAPEAMQPGERTKWTGDAEFDEYLWRLVLAKRDRDAFRADLAKSFPGKPVLFVSYGDHQPALARLPMANALEIADKGTAWQMDPTSRAFETYYAVDAIGFTPRIALPSAPILEIPYLATITIAAAGLPLDAVYENRLRLLKRCRGLFTACGDPETLTAFQRWVVDAGWSPSR